MDLERYFWETLSLKMQNKRMWYFKFRFIFWWWYTFKKGKDKFYSDSYEVQPPSELINNNNDDVFILHRLHPDDNVRVITTLWTGRITFNEDGQRVQLAWPELPAPHYICMYRLLPTTPPSPSRHYYPRLIAGTNLLAPKGWIAWLAKADCTHITFAQGYYTI